MDTHMIKQSRLKPATSACSSTVSPNTDSTTNPLQKKPSILLTNLFELARTGSELHILSLAEAFKNKGWDVTVFCLLKGLPLQQAFIEKEITLYDYQELDKLADHYDVFFAQHQLPSELVWQRGISFNKLILSSLSPYSHHESLPLFAPYADILLVNSKETLDVRSEEWMNLYRKCKTLTPSLTCQLDNRDLNNLDEMIFLNYASIEAFDFGRLRAAKTPGSSEKVTKEPMETFANNDITSDAGQVSNPPLPKNEKKPKKIAVISNHVPREVRDAAALFTDAGIECNFFGYEGVSVDITPEFLGSYDLVISIGQTAQACFATKTPLYCYDTFGGPGYLDIKTIDEAEKYNYSGRNAPVKRSAQELFEDIISGYADNLENLYYLWELAHERYSFKKQFDALYCLLQKKKSILRKSSENLLPTCESVSMRVAEFIASFRPFIGTMQLFYNEDCYEDCPTEENSLIILYRYHTKFTLSTSLFLAENKHLIRLDPDDKPVICTIDNAFVPDKLFDQIDQKDYFLSDDPVYWNTRKHADRKFFFYAEPFTDSIMKEYLQKTATIIDENKGTFSISLKRIANKKVYALSRNLRKMASCLLKKNT